MRQADAVRYGSFLRNGESPASARLGVLTDDDLVLDLSALSEHRQLPWPGLLVASSLDPLLAAGRTAWREVADWLGDLIANEDPEFLAGFRHPVSTVIPQLSFTVADYVDFFACEQHAVNAGRIFGARGDALAPNWRHMPVGYHGRSGTVRGSGAPIRRPNGQRGPGDFGPSHALDFEAELGFVIGGQSVPGEPVDLASAVDHLFGVVLLSDWSARDIQLWESRPLGPLLGKAFGTSISCWVTPWDAFASALVPPPPRDPEPLPYLRGPADLGLDIAVQVRLNGELICEPPGTSLYWTAPQLIAHLTSGGAPLRPGDLLGSGTLSGARRSERGCLLELTWGGREPLTLPGGSELTYLRDGDELVITADAPAVGGGRLELGEVRARVLPAFD
ncbi:MAG: fumarylacetoacetate hydrolase family protein [Pseudonocardia sp.]|nr:fumarylacetoacetate hydrolase family protein [Pseudonocardia sp.]